MAVGHKANTGDAKRAEVIRRGPYVRLEGGPYAAAIYTQKDWEIRCFSEKWGIEDAKEDREAILAQYRETKREFYLPSDHKVSPGLKATVWRWTGKVEPMNQAGRRGR